MKSVILDCDNTFGIPDCDVDDALALFYLLGSGKARMLGITATHGNRPTRTTYGNTAKLLRTIGRADLPLLRGREGEEPPGSEAAVFLTRQARQAPGEVWLAATGSMSNLADAYALDSTFFQNLAGLSLMGGVTEPLRIGGRTLDELNFSCDPAAALCVLREGRRVRLATGNACLGAFFEREQARRRLSASPTGRWILERIDCWFRREREVFGHDGLYQWDVCAAAALLEPEWFDWEETTITPTAESLQTGSLMGGGAAVTVEVPCVRDRRDFAEHICDAYLNNRWIQNEEETEDEA